ncbi:MAG: CCA tRNA nucleotidyltransferase [Pirellulaceae bacterium]
MCEAQAQIDRQFAIDVVKRLAAAGYQALWAGGCVRDLLMGNDPADYDVATSATPAQVRRLFGNRHSLAVGASFGVIVVLDEKRKGQQIEVATFRTDATYSDGRRPDAVSFSTPEEDAQRRDFTINGMFYDPLNEQVIDYVGGRADLEHKIIRAIGSADERIAEDKLRMLRAIRFAARFNFELHDQTLAAVTRHASEIVAISGERMAVEIQKTLQTDSAVWALTQLHQTGLMREVLPELAYKWEEHAQPALELLDSVLRIQCSPPLSATPLESALRWRVRLAALLYRCCLQREPLAQAAKPTWLAAITSLQSRLKLSNEDAQALQYILGAQRVLDLADQGPWSRTQPWLVQPNIESAMQLLAARSIVGDASAGVVPFLLSRLQQPRQELNPPPLVDGSDLIRLGLKPGPRFAQLLSHIRNQQLDNAISTRAAALEWLSRQDLSDAQT